MVMFENLKRDSFSTYDVYGDFKPSTIAASVMTSAFSWATVITVYYLVRYRKVTVNPVSAFLLFLGTPILSLAGYAIRIPSVANVSDNGLYLANMLVIALAPIYLSTVTWIVFAALVQYVGPQYSMVRPHLLVVPVFLLLIATLQLEVRGLVYAYNYSSDSQTVGAGLMLGGLGVQLVFAFLYLYFFVVFARRYFRENSSEPGSRVREFYIVLMANNILFIIRTVYRIVEFSFLARNGDQISEVYLYVFDALPTFVGAVMYAFSLPYELPFRKTCQRRRRNRCGRRASCNDGANGPWAEEAVVEESSSIAKVPIA